MIYTLKSGWKRKKNNWTSSKRKQMETIQKKLILNLRNSSDKIFLRSLRNSSQPTEKQQLTNR